jgi:hypothetical protein
MCSAQEESREPANQAVDAFGSRDAILAFMNSEPNARSAAN